MLPLLAPGYAVQKGRDLLHPPPSSGGCEGGPATGCPGPSWPQGHGNKAGVAAPSQAS